MSRYHDPFAAVPGNISVELSPTSALSAVVTVRTGTSVRISVTARGNGHDVTVPMTSRPSCLHRLALVGLRPSTTYLVSATADIPCGTAWPVGLPVPVRSGALPADFPQIRASADRARMLPGLTLFNLMPWRLPARQRPAIPLDLADQPMLGYLLAVDEEGQVVWYYRAELGIEDARQLPNGDLLISYDDCAARQIDVLGTTVREWATRVATEWMPVDDLGRPRIGPAAIPIAADSMHHEVALLPSGNLLFLSTELRELADTGPGRCEVIGDVAVEADSVSGAVIGEWRLLDVLDPARRPGAHLHDGGLRAAPPVTFYPKASYPRDWSHANAVVVDRRHNALLLSLRHLDCVTALRYQEDISGPAGELLWEFGPTGTVRLASGDWPYHQHAVELQEDGGILLYDNGVGRSGHSSRSGNRRDFSRAVLFSLEDRPGRPPVATQRWEHRLPHGDSLAFSWRLGDADRLPNGSVLITHGHLPDRAGRVRSRIVEVVPSPPAGGEIVFDLSIDDERMGWCVYRAARIASLYGCLPATGAVTRAGGPASTTASERSSGSK